MAELLVKLVSSTNPDKAKDRAGCYKKGDVVVVREDGHEWGKEERPPKFQVVRIPSIPAASLKYLTESEISAVTAAPEVLTQRRHSINLDQLPSGQNISRSQLLAATRVKVNGI